MKKLLSVLALLFVGLVFMGLLPGTDASASEAKLNASKKKICVGASFNLSLDDVKGKVTWKSSDKSVATVRKGVVTAVAPGKTKITAKNGGKKYTCKITVVGAKETESSKKKLEVIETGIEAERGLLVGEYCAVQVNCEDPENYESYFVDSEGNALIHEVFHDIFHGDYSDYQVGEASFTISDNKFVFSDTGRFYTLSGERLKNEKWTGENIFLQGQSDFSDGVAVTSIYDFEANETHMYLVDEEFNIIREIKEKVDQEPGVVTALGIPTEGMIPFHYAGVNTETQEILSSELIGYYNNKGKLIEVKNDKGEHYELGYDFSDGLALVKDKETGLCGFINKKGKTVIPCEYVGVFGQKFSDGYALVTKLVDGVEKSGVIDRKGNIVIPFEYDARGYFPAYMNGVFTLVKDDKVGIVNKKGKVVVPFEYVDVDRFSKYFMSLISEDGRKTVFSMKGKKLIPADEYASIWTLGEKTILAYNGVSGRTDLIDLDDTVLLSVDKDLYYVYLNETLGMVGYDREGKFGYESFDGQIIVPFEYDDISHFSENGIGYGVKDGKLYVLKLK